VPGGLSGRSRPIFELSAQAGFFLAQGYSFAESFRGSGKIVVDK
jgi:hypothetical protein